MSKIAWRGLALSMLLAALPLGASAQDAAAVLQPVAEALRLGEVTGLRLVASGSGYERAEEAGSPPSATQGSTAAQGLTATQGPTSTQGLTATQAATATQGSTATQGAAGGAAGRTAAVDPSSPMYVPPPAPRSRTYFRILRYVEELDLDAESLRIEERRADSSAPDAEELAPAASTIDANADWSERHRYWLTPHAFVAAALAGNATLANETLGGVDYSVVSVTVDGGHEVRGYIDEEGRLARVRTTVEDGAGTTDVVESFFEWADRGDLTFPSMLIRKENDELAQVLVVQEIDAR